ncbi:MAG: hypothetical protein U0L49_10980 [Eubacterium sp.]|nr:hypothetical protein [Eubacterium sp.]
MRFRIREKLKDQSGATLLLAILFFTICAVVGSVVLTGATGVAGRMASADQGMTSADQKTYSLKSAEKFINDMISGESVCSVSVWKDGICEKASYSTLNEDGSENFIDPEAANEKEQVPDTVLKKLVGTVNHTLSYGTGNCWEENTSEGGLYCTKCFALQLDEDTEGKNVVYCQFFSDDTYNITARFYYSQSDTEPAAILSFPAEKHVYPDRIVDDKQLRKVRVSWGDGEIQ